MLAFQFFDILVLFLHFAHGRREAFRRYLSGNFYNRIITVIPKPVF